jgi:ribosomal protein S18 acetylase RimI-like enzyme
MSVNDVPADPFAALEGVTLERVLDVTDEVVEAVRRLYPQLTEGPVPDGRAIARVLERGAVVWVARLEGHIVGMGTLAIVTVMTGMTAHIEDVVVDSGVRGRGIGEMLMRELITMARAAGADEVTLTSGPTREAANRLYRRLGFALGGTNYYWLGLDPASE